MALTPATGFYALEITDVRAEGVDAVSLAFEVPDGLRERFAFLPGQYLTLRAEVGGEDVRRPYSICSLPGEALRVGIRRVEHGRLSTFACTELKVGGTLEVRPPEGRFAARVPLDQPRRHLLLASGSGITPMLSIAGAALAGHPDSHVTLVYGNRRTDTIMFHESLDDLKNRYMERFSLVHLLSREQQDVALLNGRLEPAKLDELAEAGLADLDRAHDIYLCGPGTMIDTLRSSLESRHIEAARIHAERFEAAADAAQPSEIAVQAVSEGVEVDVILDGVRRHFSMRATSEAVLQAGTAAGLDLPFSCTGGMCATCRCKVVEGAVEMAVNYSLEPWELEAGFVLACQSRPTTQRVVLDFDAT